MFLLNYTFFHAANRQYNKSIYSGLLLKLRHSKLRNKGFGHASDDSYFPKAKRKINNNVKMSLVETTATAFEHILNRRSSLTYDGKPSLKIQQFSKSELFSKSSATSYNSTGFERNGSQENNVPVFSFPSRPDIINEIPVFDLTRHQSFNNRNLSFYDIA